MIENWNENLVNDLKEKISNRLLLAGQIVETNAKKICPYDTGRLRDSITTELIDDDTVNISTNVDYAVYVEFGTYKQNPQSFLRDGLEMSKSDIMYLFKDLI